MNRNREVMFNTAPAISFKRSGFDLSHHVKTGFNAGKLIPMGEPIEVLPGDTFSIDLAMLVRMNPTINVPLDDCFLDTYFFFVPNRLIWNHWKEFCGENNSSAWVNNTVYTIPTIQISKYDSVSHDPVQNPILATTVLGNMLPGNNYLFSDSKSSNYQRWQEKISALPVRAYCKIWQDYFRSENLEVPLSLQVGDTNSAYITPGVNDTNVYANNKGATSGGLLLPVNRFKDYFSSCLPAPQKGQAVRIPLNSEPVGIPFKMDDGYYASLAAVSGTTRLFDDPPGDGGGPLTNNYVIGLNNALMGTIDELRLAFQVQKFLWRQGVSGTRYVEILKGQFGVTSPDGRLQNPEYLGGKRIMINVNTVVQTSESGSTPQGTATGYSVTADSSFICSKSFTEHGYIVPVYCVRTNRSYSQGISKMWWRKTYLDFYWPVFANLGEQPVFKRELCLSSSAAPTYDEVFGYQEAWAEYRYLNNVSVGFMTPYYNIGQYWSYEDIYASKPSLSADWLNEGMTNLNRTLAISGSSSVPQFLADFYIKIKAVRPMPLYSVPGLADHF